MKIIKHIFGILFTFFVFLVITRNVYAQSCVGSVTCCTVNGFNQQCVNGTGNECTPGWPGCNCVVGPCTQSLTHQCGFNSGYCGISVPDSLCNYQLYGSCYVTSPVASGPTPANGSCNSNWCTSAANCASNNGTSSPGNGFCATSTDVRCCVTSGTGGYVAACSWNSNPAGCTPDGVNRQYNNGVPTRPGCCNGLTEDGFGTCGCPVLQKPPAPGNLSGICQSNGITVSWSAAARATNYLLRIDDLSTAATPCTAGATATDICISLNQTSYTLYAPPGRRFSWWVHGENSAGYGPAASLITDCTPPNPPTNLTGQCTTSGNLFPATLNWVASSNATSYSIRIDDKVNGWTGLCNGAGDNPGDICASVNVPTTNYSFNGQAGHAYDISVFSVSSNGQSSTAVTSFSCPNNRGNISVKTTLISGSQLCNNAVNWTSLFNGVSITSNAFTPNSQTTQNGSNPVSWNNVTVPEQNVTFNTPPGYLLNTLCYENTATAGVYTADIIHANLFINANTTTNYIAGFVPNVAWSQVSGGDLVSCGDINQQIPTTVDPLYKYLNLSGTGGYPGVVTYGSTGSFDIDPDLQNDGKYMVSPLNWVVKSTPTKICDMDWYKYFGIQMDMLTPSGTTPNNPASLTKSDLFGGESVVVKKLVNSTPNTTFTTTGDIVINSGESLVLFVEGNLKFNGKLTRTGTGFAAFIVNGDITVDGSVGSSDTTPSLQGIFIARGAFNTGRGTQITNERLVVKGTVLAGSINLQRSLDFSGNNITTPADKFFYDPELLFLMPDKMKDVKVNWKEVEP